MTLGQKISALRSENELTQKELAAQLGITTGTIAEWEADETTPNLSELSRLSKALNVSSDVLLETTTEEIPAPVSQPKQEPTPVVAPVKRRKKTVWIIGAAVVLVALVTGVLFLFRSIPFSENAFAIETADASVVTIFCYDYEGELAATGSGFVAFDGKTIITNYHVMTSAYTCKVSTNQDISYEVSKILCYSKKQDIAILQLAEDTKLQPLTLGDSSIIKKGETVVAIGSPLGIKNTVSTGVLSGRLMEDNMDVLQFSAPISSGSSGGALFDNNGNVIGITYASYIDGQNLNLAIPIELAAKLYDERGTAKNVSAIHLEKYPHIAFLERNKNIPEVTLSNLRSNPKKYDGKIVKLITYISSYEPDEDGWKYSDLCVSEKADISFDISSDRISGAGKDFEDDPILWCGLSNCSIPTEEISMGNKIVILGTFTYSEGSHRVKGDGSSWRDYLGVYNRGYMDAKYIYLDK